MAKARQIVGLDVQAPTRVNARVIVRARLEEMYDWEQFIDNQRNVHELHNLRIAAKRLRYTLETFADALPASSQDAIKEVERIQEELGTLHDSDVMIALLHRTLAGSEDSADHTRNSSRNQRTEEADVSSELVATLLDPKATPSRQERTGLRRLLRHLEREREEHYIHFRQHWSDLQARDFRREVLSLVDA